MTNDEAIKYLGYLRENYTREGSLMCQAVDTAIAALQTKPIRTNADRIRKMTDEELAVFLNRIIRHCREESCDDGCPMADCCQIDKDYQEKWLAEVAG